MEVLNFFLNDSRLLFLGNYSYKQFQMTIDATFFGGEHFNLSTPNLMLGRNMLHLIVCDENAITDGIMFKHWFFSKPAFTVIQKEIVATTYIPSKILFDRTRIIGDLVC